MSWIDGHVADARILYLRWPSYGWRILLLLLGLILSGMGAYFNAMLPALLGFLFIVAGLVFILFALLISQRLALSNPAALLHELFVMSQARASDQLALIDLGLRLGATEVCRYLTTGTLVVVDIYNPLLFSDRHLQALRRKAPRAPSDKRLKWMDSQVDLLPLPDRRVQATFMPGILSTLGQAGDASALLCEAFRVLKPNGRLLILEWEANWQSWLVLGPRQFAGLRTADHWRSLLTEAGFKVERVEDRGHVISLLRADKPSPHTGRQLAMEFHA